MTYESELAAKAIYQKSQGYWKLNVQQMGIRKSFYSSLDGKAGRKECAKKALAWLSLETPSNVADNTTVDQLYQAFLVDKALETTDIRSISSRYKNHIKPVIGHKPIIKLTRQDLKRVITTAYSMGGLSKKSLLNLRGDLSSFCNYLDFSNIRHDLRTSNIPIPRGAKKGKKNTLTAKDLYLLFTRTDTVLRHKSCRDDLLYAYRFHVLYGPRPGELMGLQWGDIDFKNNVIHIRRSINEKGKTTDGKNEYAERDLPMTRKAKELLIAQMVYRYDPDDPTERVFGDYSEITYRWRWKLFCECNGITYVTPYELRHTFASVNKKLPVWELDEIMGHVHSGISLGIYAHTLDGDMDDIDSLLDSNLQKQIDIGKAAFEAAKAHTA